MNIFETMEKTSRRIEPFHSQFPADALHASIGGDRSLFNQKWVLDIADDLATVKEFDGFQAKYLDAWDISWLDIAAIFWSGSELWRSTGYMSTCTFHLLKTASVRGSCGSIMG